MYISNIEDYRGDYNVVDDDDATADNDDYDDYNLIMIQKLCSLKLFSIWTNYNPFSKWISESTLQLLKESSVIPSPFPFNNLKLPRYLNLWIGLTIKFLKVCAKYKNIYFVVFYFGSLYVIFCIVLYHIFVSYYISLYYIIFCCILLHLIVFYYI